MKEGRKGIIGRFIEPIKPPLPEGLHAMQNKINRGENDIIGPPSSFNHVSIDEFPASRKHPAHIRVHVKTLGDTSTFLGL